LGQEAAVRLDVGLDPADQPGVDRVPAGPDRQAQPGQLVGGQQIRSPLRAASVDRSVRY